MELSLSSVQHWVELKLNRSSFLSVSPWKSPIHLTPYPSYNQTPEFQKKSPLVVNLISKWSFAGFSTCSNKRCALLSFLEKKIKKAGSPVWFGLFGYFFFRILHPRNSYRNTEQIFERFFFLFCAELFPWREEVLRDKKNCCIFHWRNFKTV